MPEPGGGYGGRNKLIVIDGSNNIDDVLIPSRPSLFADETLNIVAQSAANTVPRSIDETANQRHGSR